MSDTLAALLLLLVPLRHSKADRRMAKDTLAFIQARYGCSVVTIVISFLQSK